MCLTGYVLYVVLAPKPLDVAHQFIGALVKRDWHTAYQLASDRERERLGWDEATFERFATRLADEAWPPAPEVSVREVLPPPPPAAKPGMSVMYTQGPDPNTKLRMAVTMSWKSSHGAVTAVWTAILRKQGGRAWRPDLMAAMIEFANAGRTGQPRLTMSQCFDRALHEVGASRVIVFPMPSPFPPDGLTAAASLGSLR
jgi:hypothetical protein